MAHLFVGHGSLDPAGHSYNEGMGIVAVPPGTTLQFYTDAGQNLRLGSMETAFAQLQAPWPALTSENVTYNLSLSRLPIETAVDRWLAIAKTAHTPHFAGLGGLPDPIQLCTGTTDQCPTDPRENREHTCAGLLARYIGELHWIACTGFVLPENQDEAEETETALDGALAGRPQSAYLNSNPDSWDEHVANLVVALKPMLTNYLELGDIAGFLTLFNGDEFTDEEREMVKKADDDIRVVVDGP